MNSKSHLLFLTIFITAISFLGCVSKLHTKVEVYNPEARLAQLEMRKSRPKTGNLDPEKFKEYLRKRVVEEKLGVKDPREWIRHAIATINKLGWVTLPTEEWFDQKARESSDVSMKNAYLNTKMSYLDNCREVRDRAMSALVKLADKYNQGKKSFIDTFSDAKKIVERFSDEYTKAVVPVKGIGYPEAITKLSVQARERIPTALAALRADTNLTYEKYGQSLGRYIMTSMKEAVGPDTIHRPDVITETRTDPLMVIAQADREGWTDAVNRTYTNAQGNCSFVVIRETPYSFSIHSVTNDPTQLVKLSLGLAESTLNIIAKVASTYFTGVPISIPPVKKNGAEETIGGEVEPSAPVEKTKETKDLNSKQLRSLAKSRLSMAQQLNEVKVDIENPEKVKQWVNKVNSLFQPLSSK